MQPQLKQLGLTQLEKALPTLYETARQEQWTYETFMNRALASEIEGRDRRAAERRMTAASSQRSRRWRHLILPFNLNSQNGCCGSWPISASCRRPRT